MVELPKGVRPVVRKRRTYYYFQIGRATMTAAMNEDGLNYDRTFDPITLKENSVAVSSS